MAKKEKTGFTNIIQYVLLVIAVVVFILIMINGFKQDPENQPPVIIDIGVNSSSGTSNQTVQPTDGIPEQYTDSELYNQLLGKADFVESVWYNLSDTALDENNLYMIRGRFGKILLDEPETVNGDRYDWIYFDRLKKVAIARCSQTLCGERDLELDSVDYDKNYQLSPLEWMYKFKDPVYVVEEMMGRHVVKVFDVKTLDDKPGKIWLQEHYGVPLKIEFETDTGTRTIEFNDLHFNYVKIGHVMLPINMTVDGKQYDYGWFGYLAKEFNEELKFN